MSRPAPDRGRFLRSQRAGAKNRPIAVVGGAYGLAHNPPPRRAGHGRFFELQRPQKTSMPCEKRQAGMELRHLSEMSGACHTAIVTKHRSVSFGPITRHHTPAEEEWTPATNFKIQLFACPRAAPLSKHTVQDLALNWRTPDSSCAEGRGSPFCEFSPGSVVALCGTVHECEFMTETPVAVIPASVIDHKPQSLSRKSPSQPDVSTIKRSRFPAERRPTRITRAKTESQNERPVVKGFRLRPTPEKKRTLTSKLSIMLGTPKRARREAGLKFTEIHKGLAS